MRKGFHSILFALAVAVFTPFAIAIDVCKHTVCRFADTWEDYGKAVVKFKAELVANYGCRTTEAGRANGLVKESNGFRMANLFKASGLPIEVGWQSVKV